MLSSGKGIAIDTTVVVVSAIRDMEVCRCSTGTQKVALGWLFLLLLLLLFPQLVSANAECRFRTNSQGSFYKPGEAMISGIFSLIRAVITVLHFREPPERRCGMFK